MNGLTHFFAAIAASIGLVIRLPVAWDNLNKAMALTIYGINLVLLFAASH